MEDIPTLKKDWFGYRIVYPIKNLDGTINWWNLLVGGKRNAFRLLIYSAIILLIYFGVNELISSYKLIAANPCEFCENCFSKYL